MSDDQTSADQVDQADADQEGVDQASTEATDRDNADNDNTDDDLELFVPVMVLPISVGRHSAAVFVLAVLGFLFLSIVIKTPPASIWASLFLIGVGALSLYVSYLMFLISNRALHLTADELRDDTGKLLCLVKDIKSVERGALAFKPSNGFVIVLRSNVQRGWAPGLWWSFGRRIGVGGVTSAGAGKAMGDVLAARVATLELEAQNA